MNLIHGDALVELAKLPPASIDLIFTDPPYNMTAVACDQEPIDLNLMWAEFIRILKPNGVAVIFAAEPFNVDLINANRVNYRYSWIWEKSNSTGHLRAKKQPMRAHETLCVFYKKQPTYNPQMGEGKAYTWASERTESEHFKNTENALILNLGTRYPRSVLRFKQERGLHPLQKPTDLSAYMIDTYSNEGDMVLDPFMGSGTTGVAAKNLKRSFIGIEKNQEYYDVAVGRINEP